MARHFILAVVLALVTMIASTLHAAPLRPTDFVSLGPLPQGNVAIDTDALTFGGNPGGVLVVQGGGAPDIAVFTFDGGSALDSGDSITVSGQNALAVLFQGSVVLSGTIDVSGGDGAAPIPRVITGVGGTGVAGGGRGGNGGPFSSLQDGAGPGGGSAGGSSASAGTVGSGAGGGFGTPGGNGGFGVTTRPGGVAYGDPLRELLFAGSGGGGGGGQNVNNLGAGGGAGGGALEIGALTTLEFAGATILANGGGGGDSADGVAAAAIGKDGGGGSGGGLLLHGHHVAIDAATLIQANGGNGGFFQDLGGCGGAGRIEILHNTGGSLSNSGAVEAMSGAFGGECTDGELVVTPSSEVGIPEPSTATLLVMGCAALVNRRASRRIGPWAAAKEKSPKHFVAK